MYIFGELQLNRVGVGGGWQGDPEGDGQQRDAGVKVGSTLSPQLGCSIASQSLKMKRPRVAREQRICQRCLSGEVDDEHHMVFDCPALEEVRVQHAGLFAGSADLRSFLAQESSQVAAFVSAGFDAVLGD